MKYFKSYFIFAWLAWNLTYFDQQMLIVLN